MRMIPYELVAMEDSNVVPPEHESPSAFAVALNKLFLPSIETGFRLLTPLRLPN